MLQSLLAPNPSPLTGPGTNTFLLGRKTVAVIDPGPDLPAHRAAILQAGAGRISHIFVTHAHLDHSGGAAALATATGAPVLAYGDATAGRSALMEGLGTAAGGGEGVDHGFTPNLILRDNEEIRTAEWSLRALHTPGHMGGHLAFQWGDALFCGDVILGWSSTLISPPDGDLVDYLRSLDRIEALAPARLYPAHGDPVEAPLPYIAGLRAHRRERSAQIIAALKEGPSDAADLATRIYRIDPALLPAATRNVLAHLLALWQLGAVICEGTPTADRIFALP